MNKVLWQGYELDVKIMNYRMGTPVIVLSCIINGPELAFEDEEMEVVATKYIEGLEPDEVAIKDYSENVGMLKALLAAEIITQPHRYIQSGFVSFPVCRINQ